MKMLGNGKSRKLMSVNNVHGAAKLRPVCCLFQNPHLQSRASLCHKFFSVAPKFFLKLMGTSSDSYINDFSVHENHPSEISRGCIAVGNRESKSLWLEKTLEVIESNH